MSRYITNSSPDANVLGAADLVMISHSVNSGDYSNDGATAWNNIRTPMIVTGGCPLRNSRMGYTTGGTMVDTTGDIKLAVSDPNHPIFDGIAMTDGVMDNPFAGVVNYPTDGTLARGVSINNNEVNAYGEVLGTVADTTDPNDPNAVNPGPIGGTVIGEWSMGDELTHNGGAGTDLLAGPRLVFLTGAREADGISSLTAASNCPAPTSSRPGTVRKTAKTASPPPTYPAGAATAPRSIPAWKPATAPLMASGRPS